MGAASSTSIKAQFEKKKQSLGDSLDPEQADIYAADFGSEDLKKLKKQFRETKMKEFNEHLNHLKQISETFTNHLTLKDIETAFFLERKRSEIPNVDDGTFEDISALKGLSYEQLLKRRLQFYRDDHLKYMEAQHQRSNVKNAMTFEQYLKAQPNATMTAEPTAHDTRR